MYVTVTPQAARNEIFAQSDESQPKPPVVVVVMMAWQDGEDYAEL